MLATTAFFAAVHVVPPSDDSWTHSHVVPPLLFIPTDGVTVIPLIDVTVAGSPNA